MKRLESETWPLDRVDATILRCLVEDARMSMAELARRLGFSPPSVSERVRRLEEAGVIESYTAIMNPEAIGLPISAYIRIRPVPGELAKVLEIIAGLEEIVRCDRVTGEDCIIARAHVASIGDLEALVDEFARYATTSTSVIQSTPVPYRLPAFPVRR